MVWVALNLVDILFVRLFVVLFIHKILFCSIVSVLGLNLGSCAHPRFSTTATYTPAHCCALRQGVWELIKCGS